MTEPLDDLADAEAVPLPGLTRAQLLALGDAARSPLVDAAEQAWVQALLPPERERLVEQGRAALREQGLLVDDRPIAALSAVLAARTAPSTIAVLGQPGRDQREAPRAYGVQQGGALAWLLVERAGDDGSSFTAVVPELAVEQISTWLAGDAALSRMAGVLEPAEPVVRSLEVLHPTPDGGDPARARLVVASRPGLLVRLPVRADGTTGGAEPYDVQQLRADVRQALGG